MINFVQIIRSVIGICISVIYFELLIQILTKENILAHCSSVIGVSGMGLLVLHHVPLCYSWRMQSNFVKLLRIYFICKFEFELLQNNLRLPFPILTLLLQANILQIYFQIFKWFHQIIHVFFICTILSSFITILNHFYNNSNQI